MDTVLNHNIKLGNDNAVILSKTQTLLPLFEDLSDLDRTIDKIDNLTNIIIKGRGFNKDGKILLSFITKKCFSNNNLKISISEDDFLNYKGVAPKNKYKHKGLIKGILDDILSTNYSWTTTDCVYNCNFLDSFIEEKNKDGVFTVILGRSYIDTFIRDKFFVKYPVEISVKINGDVADRIYSLLQSINYFPVNVIQIENIRLSCFNREDLTKENLKKTNIKIKNAIIQLEKLKLISNVEIIYKGKVRKIVDDYKYSIVSQYKNKPVIEHNTDNEKSAIKKDTDFEHREFVPFLEHNPEALKDNNFDIILDLSIIDDKLPF